MAAPSEHSQPSMQQAYEAADNPVTKEPAERNSSSAHKASSETVEQRLPHDQSTQSDYSKSASNNRDTEDLGEQRDFNDAGGMAPASEGDVHDAVVGNKTGASGSEPDLASDLDRKKAEQAGARESAKASRDKNIDVGGALGQRGGPANTPQFG